MKTLALAAVARPLPRATLRLVRNEVLPAALPVCAPVDDARAIVIAEPLGERADAFRELVHVLTAKGLPRVLAVTAPMAGEGATTCALNLALVLAENPKSKVLLVEANFASPALGTMLGVATGSSSPSFSDPFALSALGALHVATFARRSGAPAHLDAMTLGNLLAWARRTGYARIVIDAPSVEKPFESDLIFGMSGGVLVAMRSGHTTRAALVRAASHIGKEKALGVMMLESPRA